MLGGGGEPLLEGVYRSLTLRNYCRAWDLLKLALGRTLSNEHRRDVVGRSWADTAAVTVVDVRLLLLLLLRRGDDVQNARHPSSQLDAGRCGQSTAARRSLNSRVKM